LTESFSAREAIVMRQYIALIQTNPDQRLVAKLPDFPGLFLVAKTFDKLRELLTEDLASRIEEMEQAGNALPEPSSFEILMADPQNRDCAAILIWARGARQATPGGRKPAEPLHGESNDEWPEADA
jgi:predicted RNase H-like HicB family nuclease